MKLKTKTCPHCGKEFEDSKHPNKEYCSMTCFLESRYEVVLCDCGKQFKRSKRRHRDRYKYCSRECAYKYIPHKPINPSKRAERICNQCGATFECWSYRTNQFCSRKCADEGQRIPESKVTKLCVICGTPYMVTRHFVTKRSSSCCSRECANKLNSIKKRGFGNVNYKGGSAKYRGSNWGSQRRKALKRDGRTCQICGKHAKPNQRRIIDIHHIKPYREFNGDYESANDLANLVTLCKQCHAKVEHGKLACPKRLL